MVADPADHYFSGKNLELRSFPPLAKQRTRVTKEAAPKSTRAQVESETLRQRCGKDRVRQPTQQNLQVKSSQPCAAHAAFVRPEQASAVAPASDPAYGGDRSEERR